MGLAYEFHRRQLVSLQYSVYRTHFVLIHDFKTYMLINIDEKNLQVFLFFL